MAHENVKQGNEKLRGALKEQQKARKLKCILMIVLLVIILVIALYSGMLSI